jgi:predicted Zn-dependent peptidase
MNNLTVNYQENEKKIDHFVFNNGINLIVIENSATNVIAGRIFLKNGGGRWEKRSQAGIFHLLAAVITKGTENLSSVEIAERVESMGASLGTDAATDYFLVSLKTVAADFEEMLPLAAEILRSPTFPPAEVELEKHLTLQNLLSQKEQPFNVAFNQLREMMYGEHPYGVSIVGTEQSVSNLTPFDLKQYHSTYFRPDNLVISLAGKVTKEAAIKMVEKVFGDWQPPQTPIPQIILDPASTQPHQVRIKQDTQQSIIMLGYLAAGVKSEDYPILKLLSTYLGNGLSSRLFVELREKRGLAYDVSSFYPTRLDKSQFVVYMGTAPQNTEVAIEGLQREVERLWERTLSSEELQAAKNKLLGQYALGKQTNAEFAQIYGWYESLGLGIEFDRQFQKEILQITPEMAQKVAANYFQAVYLSLVGPQ